MVKYPSLEFWTFFFQQILPKTLILAPPVCAPLRPNFFSISCSFWEILVISYVGRCGSRIWSGGAQLLRLKVADAVKQSRASEASNLWLGSRARLRALEAFGFLMLKYAFSHILETLFLSFLISILTLKVDKNRALDFTSINLRHSCILHLFFNLHEKVML